MAPIGYVAGATRIRGHKMGIGKIEPSGNINGMFRQSEINGILEELNAKKTDIRCIIVYYETDDGRYQTRFRNISAGHLTLVSQVLTHMALDAAQQASW